MLPFSTYNIPDTTTNETVQSTNRLIFVLNEVLSDQQFDLLRKISAALKTDFDKDVLVHILKKDSNQSLSEFIVPSTELIISFGIAPSGLGLWIDLTTSGIRFLEEFSFILANAISDLEKNANAKKTLWSHMQLFMEMRTQPYA